MFTRTMKRAGQFGDFKVFGSQFQTETGEISWNVTVQDSANIWEYWITKGEIGVATVHTAHPTKGNTIENFGRAEDVPPNVEKVIREAIAKWCREYPTDATESASLKGLL